MSHIDAMDADLLLSDYLSRQDFVAFDTETTGLWAPSCRIVEIGAVKFRLGEPDYDTFQSLINPERPIPSEVIRIHGITDEMVAGAPSAAEVLQDFFEFCSESAVLIAHNAPFDISFVGCELDRAQMDYGDHVILDTLDIFQRFHPEIASYSLLSLAQHFAVAVTQAHRAVADALIVKHLFELAADKFSFVHSADDLIAILTTYRMTDWQSQYGTLPDQFADLTRAIEENRRVRITYTNNLQGQSTRVIRPKQVYQMRSAFYINAYCERAGAERTFRLDRIGDYTVLTE